MSPEPRGIDEELAERPVPSPAFRAELDAQLRERTLFPAWRPKRAGRLALAYLGAGLALLALVAIGLAGVGPFGY